MDKENYNMVIRKITPQELSEINKDRKSNIKKKTAWIEDGFQARFIPKQYRTK